MYSRLASIVLFCFFLSACATKIPKEALQLQPESLQKRESQTRYFETGSEHKLLSASSQVLQDLGFNLDESEVDLGVVVGSKHRDATHAGQIVGAIFLAALTGAVVPVDKDQIIRVSLVTKPIDFNKEDAERVTDKLRQKLVDKIKDKTHQVLNKELSEGLEGQLADSIIYGITEKLAFQFGESLSEELKAQLAEGRTAVRVTFQRVIYNTQNQITSLESLDDPKLYQEFFDKLSQSVFLEAHTL